MAINVAVFEMVRAQDIDELKRAAEKCPIPGAVPVIVIGSVH